MEEVHSVQNNLATNRLGSWIRICRNSNAAKPKLKTNWVNGNGDVTSEQFTFAKVRVFVVALFILKV
jgi:hypothetical protein